MTPPASTEPMHCDHECVCSDLHNCRPVAGCGKDDCPHDTRAHGPVSAQQQAYVCKEGYTPNLKFRCSQQRDIKEPDCSKCGSGILQQAPSTERIGSIRQPILQEDAYLIERVNAGMGEWERELRVDAQNPWCYPGCILVDKAKAQAREDVLNIITDKISVDYYDDLQNGKSPGRYDDLVKFIKSLRHGQKQERDPE